MLEPKLDFAFLKVNKIQQNLIQNWTATSSKSANFEGKASYYELFSKYTALWVEEPFLEMAFLPSLPPHPTEDSFYWLFS